MRFIPKVIVIALGLSILSTSFAAKKVTPVVTQEVKQPLADYQCWSPSRISMGAFGGYGVVDGAYSNDGDVTFGRMTLGLHAYDYQGFLLGAELGVQSGNTMRLDANASVISALGDLQPQATLKPFFDLLVTAKRQLTNTMPLFGVLKAGIAYRQLQLEYSNSSSDTVRKVNGELQIGLDYTLTEHAIFAVFYQGIYAGGTAGVSVDASGTNTYINRIPTQQAGFLGLEYSL